MSSVGDIGGNTGMVLDSIVGGALFRKHFPKRLRKFRIPVIYTPNIILLFRVFLGYLNLKLFLRLFSEQTQNTGVFRARGILRTPSIQPVKL